MVPENQVKVSAMIGENLKVKKLMNSKRNLENF